MNQAILIGKIESAEYDHEYNTIKYYKLIVSISRSSGAIDRIPVMVSKNLLDVPDSIVGKTAYFKGQYKSHNERQEGKSRLILYVFANQMRLTETADNINDVFVEGNLTKTPIFRVTPKGRKITEIMLAVNNESKSDYIPCILWGETAEYANGLRTGQHIRVCGRIQSREYLKNDSAMTAYEISVRLIEAI